MQIQFKKAEKYTWTSPSYHKSPIETENVFSKVRDNLRSKQGTEIQQKKESTAEIGRDFLIHVIHAASV